MRNLVKKVVRSRKHIIGLMVVSVAAFSLEFPTPIKVQKDLSTPFPCQSRGCGCKDADQCWASCCCFSDQEKLAWAKANAVEIPIWFVAKASLESETAQPPAASTACCCCSKKDPPKLAIKPQPTCCSVAQNATTKQTTADIPLSLSQERGCQGNLGFLQKHVVYLPPNVVPRQAFASWTLFLAPIERSVSIFYEPPTPPPRRLASAIAA